MNFKKYTVLTSLLAAIIISIGLTSCSSRPELPPLADDAVIVAFGDSLTFGTGAKPADSYPVVLEKLIGRRIVNSGVPGEVTGDGLLRLPEVLDIEKPDLLLLCHGGNDLLRQLDKQRTASNIREMIRLAREKQAAVVLIAVPSLGLSLSPSPIYLEIAKELSIPIEEDALSDILAKGNLKSDYIHPNADGYRRLAESIAALLHRSGAIN